MDNRSTPPLFNSILATENGRVNIEKTLNQKLIEFNTNALASVLSNVNSYINPTRTVDAKIVNNIGLEQLKDYIPENISYWQPVMQIARSARGDGTVSIPKGTATTITMYNNESADNFFTAADTGTDENNIPLCYWGYQLDNPSAGNSVVNAAPNTPPFRIYSNQKNKPGILLAKPGKTRHDTSILYYQFTFPYNCYVYMVVNAALNWNSIEGSGNNNPTTDTNDGRPSVFMITDENENTVIARTSNDDGNGKNDPSKNRPHGVIHWHGYVKKGWKLYYVEQEYSLGGPSHGKSGHCCIVFKTDNVNLKNTIDTPVLSMSKFSTSSYYNSSADIDIQLASSEHINSFIVENESKLTNLATKATIPNTPLFRTYSITNSKPGELFPAPGATDRHGYWATLAIPYDCYMSFSLMGCHHDSDYEIYGVYGLMIYDENNNLVVAKTSYDDGTGKNITNKNRYWGNIHYTGILKKGYRVYFAWIRSAKNTKNSALNQEFITNGLLVNLFRLPPANLEIESKQLSAKYYNNVVNKIVYDSVTNTTVTSVNQTIPYNVQLIIAESIPIFNHGHANVLLSTTLLYTEKVVEYDSIAIIALPNSVNSGHWRVHSFYIHTNSTNTILTCEYSHAPDYTGNLSKTIKVKVKKGDKIYLFLHLADPQYQHTGLHLCMASVTLIPVCYIAENH